jgi:hypothetical protein
VLQSKAQQVFPPRKRVGVGVEQIKDLNNVLLIVKYICNKEPQRHCKNAEKNKVLVNAFGFTKK